LILHDLFQRFAFTVTESTPLDVEVAVDPEMLGKVFEELVTGRHESGSYYTPKPIVSFMCRESLKGYLKTQAAEESPEVIALLVDEQNPEKIDNPEAVLEALKKVRICDLACGSGAYLLGMLHELLDLRQCLEAPLTKGGWGDSNTVYQHKLEIIENNLYGVDIDVFAVNIARLRLWLSLAVDYEGEKPKPLPNLKYKIEVGDSLISPNPTEIKLIDVLIEKFREVKAQYIRTHDGNQKKNLEAEITKLKKDISLLTYGKAPLDKGGSGGFDWSLDFAEIFADGGFDIVVANPPYGAKVDDKVRDLYFDRRIDGAQSKDTYGLFLARCLQLLKTNGQLSYIVSDTWRTIKSHKPLRRRILDNTTIAHIIDLPSWVFKATVNTCIFSASKIQPSKEHNLIAADLRSIDSGDWQNLTKNLDAIANSAVDLQPLNYARYTYPQSLIATYENLSFFIASPTLYKLFGDSKFSRMKSIAEVKVGLQTGDNEYYLRKRKGVRGSYQILDESKLLTERDIALLTDEEKRNGVEPKKHQGRHFLPYDKGGESDTDEGWLPNYYVPTQYFIDWSKDAVNRLRTTTRADVKQRKGQTHKITPADHKAIASRFQNSEYYFREGLTFSPTGIYSPTFRISCDAVFGNKGSTIFFKEIESKVMLGILTSTLCRYLLKSYASHTVETGEEVLTQLILSKLNTNSAQQLKSLVDQIIKKQKVNPNYQYHLNEQKEIDRLVYKLYNLSIEDIREVEIWYCRRYQKLSEAQGMLAEVRQKYANYLEFCEQNIDPQVIDLSSNQNVKMNNLTAA
jgi:type I restriction-modification system DNA methylase subunit